MHGRLGITEFAISIDGDAIRGIALFEAIFLFVGLIRVFA
jgi:hypothetical protein